MSTKGETVTMEFNKIIIGGGLYGLYSALLCGKNGQTVCLLEYESESFARATYINQARVHMGYHYPRSYSTAIKSAHYFERFVHDYPECILTEFDQIYATSANFSWTNAEQFKKFCHDAEIQCDEISPSKYFKPGMCDGAFLTKEYTYDAKILRELLLTEIKKYKNIQLYYNTRITQIEVSGNNYIVNGYMDGVSDTFFEYAAPFLLNATYASVNQICSKLNVTPFSIKYELCEIILCNIDDSLRQTGLTVMDGPFFSIMPFGKTNYHSLTSVTFTPHITSYDTYPTFPCQKLVDSAFCSSQQLGNCNLCNARPKTAWDYMSGLAHKYMKPDYHFEYSHSLFSMKPILKASEIDDSRPTVIKRHSEQPTFVSVLSGKINTVYDLEEVLLNE